MEIRAVRSMLKGSNKKLGTIKFSAPVPAEGTELPPSITVAYVNALSIAQTIVGYAVTAEMSARRLAERTEWESLSVTPFDVSLLDGSVEDLQRYAQEMQSSMGAQGLMMPGRGVESEPEIENANEETRLR